MIVPKRELSEDEALAVLAGCKRKYPNLSETVYYFIGEWGRLDQTYSQYLLNPVLRRLIINKERYVLAAGRRIYSYDLKYIAQNPKVRKMLVDIEHEVKTSPLQFFMPNGTVGLNFLNDTTSTIKMLVAGNRYGKTTHGIVDMVLDLIPCNKDWKIFTENGVKFRPWNGVPKQWGVASYMWRHITMTISPLLLQWIPDEFLGDYCLNQTGGARKIVSAEKRPFIELTNQSSLQYFCYQQDVANYESAALDGWLWDEQGMEDKFDGADERTRTKPHGRHIFPLTPHKIKGRADTGAGTWIHALWKGDKTKGHRIGRYLAHTFDNPDWIYREKEKRKAYIKHVVEPTKHNDFKALAEGRSRLEGEFHDASGLVYDELVRDIHILQPFPLEDHWTRYRGVDHGLKSPTACVMLAVLPTGDIIVYDEYYESRKTIYQNVDGMIEKSGNTRIFLERRSDLDGNTEFDEYAEVMSGTHFERTMLDGRSFASEDATTKRSWGEIYRSAGLDCDAAAGGEGKIDIVSEYFRVDYERPHLISGQKGASKVYIFSTCTMLIQELFSYVWAEEKEGVAGVTLSHPRKKNDHAVNALEYALVSQPVYLGEYTQNDLNRFYNGVRREDLSEPYEDEEECVNPLTGY